MIFKHYGIYEAIQWSNLQQNPQKTAGTGTRPMCGVVWSLSVFFAGLSMCFKTFYLFIYLLLFSRILRHRVPHQELSLLNQLLQTSLGLKAAAPRDFFSSRNQFCSKISPKKMDLQPKVSRCFQTQKKKRPAYRKSDDRVSNSKGCQPELSPGLRESLRPAGIWIWMCQRFPPKTSEKVNINFESSEHIWFDSVLTYAKVDMGLSSSEIPLDLIQQQVLIRDTWQVSMFRTPCQLPRSIP